MRITDLEIVYSKVVLRRLKIKNFLLEETRYTRKDIFQLVTKTLNV